LGLRRQDAMNQEDREKIESSLEILSQLEHLFDQGGATRYYSWLRKKLRPSQVESVLRLVEHARHLQGELQDNEHLNPAETTAADIIAPPGWGKSISIIAVALPLIETVVPQTEANEQFRVLILVPAIVIRNQLAEKVDSFFADAPGRQSGDMVELVQSDEVRDNKDYQVKL